MSLIRIFQPSTLTWVFTQAPCVWEVNVQEVHVRKHEKFLTSFEHSCSFVNSRRNEASTIQVRFLFLLFVHTILIVKQNYNVILDMIFPTMEAKLLADNVRGCRALSMWNKALSIFLTQ